MLCTPISCIRIAHDQHRRYSVAAPLTPLCATVEASIAHIPRSRWWVAPEIAALLPNSPPPCETTACSSLLCPTSIYIHPSEYLCKFISCMDKGAGAGGHLVGHLMGRFYTNQETKVEGFRTRRACSMCQHDHSAKSSINRFNSYCQLSGWFNYVQSAHLSH